jgi:hypothetical protein
MVVPNAPSRATVEAAKDDLADLNGVESVAIRPPLEHEYGTRRLVSVVVAGGRDRVPPRVLGTLHQYDLGIADVSPQGDRLIVAAV